MFRKFNDLLPVNISSLFDLNTHIHPYNTRSSHKFHCFEANEQLIMNLIRHSGPRTWNIINTDITSSCKLTSFRVKNKTSLLHEYVSLFVKD